MNKAELVELVRLNLSGGDAPAELKSRFHPKEIAKYIEMVYDDVFDGICRLGEKNGDYTAFDSYANTYVFVVSYNSVREQYYITLSPQPAPLPNGNGIRQVCPAKDQTQAFSLVDDLSSVAFGMMEVDYVDSVPGYTRENKYLYFDDKFPKGLENVMVKMVVPFASLRDTDEVFVPGGNNSVVIQKVLALMLNKPLPDLQGSNQNVTKL